MKNIFTKNNENLICECCDKKANIKINYLYFPINFTGDKSEPGVSPNCFFCSQEHRREYITKNKEMESRARYYLAELDESMNYCEYFIRENGNEGVYKREGFEFKVNGLWDYKCYSKYIPKALIFKEAFINHFGNFNRFQLHNRYNIS